jgi:hypothetical protein
MWYNEQGKEHISLQTDSNEVKTMKTAKSKLRFLPVIIFLLILLIILVIQGLLHRARYLGSIQSGGGYTQVCDAEGTCYLVDRSGIIYTVDYDTGKRTKYYEAPDSIHWVGSTDMQNLYYSQDGSLHRIHIQTDSDEVLLSEAGVGDIQAVTDHYVLYSRAAQTEEDDVLEYVDLDTLEVCTIDWSQSATVTDVLDYKNDVVVMVLENADDGGIYSVDLSTASIVQLVANTDAKWSLYNLFVIEDELVYEHMPRTGDPQYYMVSMTDPQEPQPVTLGVENACGSMVQFADGLISFATDDSLLIGKYDPGTDTLTTILETDHWGYIEAAAVHGNQYVILTMEGANVEYLRLGKIA